MNHKTSLRNFYNIDARVGQFVRRVTAVGDPTVWIQHYNFVDFEDQGSDWSPDWFNLVRDPVDRVSNVIRASISPTHKNY